MTETSGIQPGPEGGDENVGYDESMVDDAAEGRSGEGDERPSPAQGTPPIKGAGNPGQTTQPSSPADPDQGAD